MKDLYIWRNSEFEISNFDIKILSVELWIRQRQSDITLLIITPLAAQEYAIPQVGI